MNAFVDSFQDVSVSASMDSIAADGGVTSAPSSAVRMTGSVEEAGMYIEVPSSGRTSTLV